MNGQWREATPGMRIGKLTIIREVKRRNGVRFVELSCACGGRRTTAFHSFLGKRCRSCPSCRSYGDGSGRRTHGATRGGKESRLYRNWITIKRRCYSPRHSRYPDYGARGIKVCDEWRRDFIAFRDWIAKHLGKRPTGFTLDRIDNDGDYMPSNVRWASSITQGRNQRKSIYLKHPITGETKHVEEWAPILGMNIHTLRSRLQMDWPLIKVFTRPVGRGKL